MTNSVAQPPVLSFAVFDTVLTRRVGDPAGVLRLAAERAGTAGLSPEIPAQVLAATRRRVELDLTRMRGRPVRLHEIWAEAAGTLNLSVDRAEELAAIEEEIERELSVAVPGISIVLVGAREETSGAGLVFVSDTPHRVAFLRELLATAGLLDSADRVYCSADLGASKSSGGLFDLGAENLAVSPSRLRHSGHDSGADIAAPRLRNWSARTRSVARLNRYEHELENHCVATAGLTSYLAGSSRIARLEAVEAGVPGGVAQVAAGVAAPLLLGYVLWLAGQARMLGLRRLYFVARDGELLLQVARPVLQRLAPEVECHYLHASRQAFEFAALAADPRKLPTWVAGQKNQTARDVLARVGLVPEQVWKECSLPPTAPGAADRPLAPGDRAMLSAYLQRPEVQDGLLRASASQAAAATSYLRSLGLADPVPSALVDVGWRGHMAGACDALLRSGGLPPVRHLFVGVTQEAAAVRSRSSAPDMTAWLFDADRGRGVSAAARLGGLTTLVEVFCSGSQGRVSGYASDGSPLLAAERNDPVLDWGLAGYRATLLRTVELCLTQLRPAHLHIDLAPLVVQQLTAFWASPQDDEVQAWASFPWEDETWPPFAPLAQPVSTADVIRRSLRGDAGLRNTHSWRAGTARVSRQPWRALLELRALQNRSSEQLQRMPRQMLLEFLARWHST
jgi:FMN phosphatase YigB (HAD superfamily)